MQDPIKVPEDKELVILPSGKIGLRPKQENKDERQSKKD